MIQVYYFILLVSRCLAKVVDGYCNTVDQSRSVLGFYGRSLEAISAFPQTVLNETQKGFITTRSGSVNEVQHFVATRFYGTRKW